MVKYVVNPLTNRRIMVGGTTYNKLVQDGTIKSKTRSQSRSKSRSKSSLNRSLSKSTVKDTLYLIVKWISGNIVLIDNPYSMNPISKLYIDETDLKPDLNRKYTPTQLKILNNYRNCKTVISAHYYTKQEIENLDLFLVLFSNNKLRTIKRYPDYYMNPIYNTDNLNIRSKLFGPGIYSRKMLFES